MFFFFFFFYFFTECDFGTTHNEHQQLNKLTMQEEKCCDFMEIGIGKWIIMIFYLMYANVAVDRGYLGFVYLALLVLSLLKNQSQIINNNLAFDRMHNTLYHMYGFVGFSSSVSNFVARERIACDKGSFNQLMLLVVVRSI